MNKNRLNILEASTNGCQGIPLASLEQCPFENNRDTRFYFDAPAHEAAASSLLEHFNDGNQGFSLLQSEPGLGKTLLRTLLHRRLDPTRFVRVSIETSLLDFDGLLLEIISQIRGDRVRSMELPDRYSRLDFFKSLLSERIAGAGRHLVILLDEAHGFDRSVLDGLRNLSNICSERRNLMSIALFGAASLGNAVQGLPELSQRISAHLQLERLGDSLVRDYVNHRLHVAGCTENLTLDESTWIQLHQASSGIPRQINRIMKTALAQAKTMGDHLNQDSLSAAIQVNHAPGPDAFSAFA